MFKTHQCLYRVSYKAGILGEYKEVSGHNLIMDATSLYLTVRGQKISIPRNHVFNIEHICQH